MKQDAENARVAIRNVRRDVMQDVKEALKEKMITQDDEKKAEQDIQKLTDKHIADVEAIMAAKEKEIMQVFRMMGVPRHIAIIMDGNGRWAAARGQPRAFGHKHGIASVRMAIEECAKRRVEALTVFAFSSENWKRPSDEVASLMSLFMDALDREIADLHKNQVRVKFIGDRRSLSVRLQARIAAAEEMTANNPGLKLQVAVSYGGRWDIAEAARKLAKRVAAAFPARGRHHRRRLRCCPGALRACPIRIC